MDVSPGKFNAKEEGHKVRSGYLREVIL